MTTLPTTINAPRVKYPVILDVKYPVIPDPPALLPLVVGVPAVEFPLAVVPLVEDVPLALATVPERAPTSPVGEAALPVTEGQIDASAFWTWEYSPFWSAVSRLCPPVACENVCSAKYQAPAL